MARLRYFFNAWYSELMAILKDEGVLMFVFIVPLFYPLLYSWVYNNESAHDVSVAIVDLSSSHFSRELTRKLDATPEVKVVSHCSSIAEAQKMMDNGEIVGYYCFPKDFDINIKRMEQSHLGVYCDMSMMLAYKAVYSAAMSVSLAENAKIQVALLGNSTNREDEIATRPLDYEEVPIFNTTGGYGNFVLPGVLVLVIQQTLLLAVGMAAGTRRDRRVLRTVSNTSNEARKKTPATEEKFSVGTEFVARTLCYLSIFTFNAAYLLLAVPRFFGFISIPHMGDLVVFVLPLLLSCIFLAMTMSHFVRQRENVMLIFVCTSIIFIFMSGMSWPESNIPGVWKGIASLFPSTFGIRGFLRLSSMGATLDDVQHEYLCLWILTLCYFISAIIVAWLERKENMPQKQAIQ